MLPPEKKARLILNTDAKNEADDQYTIVHALLTPSLDLHGFYCTPRRIHYSFCNCTKKTRL